MKSIAFRLASTLLLVLLGLTHAHGQTGLRADVQKPLVAAQEALKNNQLDLALRLAAEAAAVPGLTPVEQQFVWRLQAVTALRSQQWDLAIERLERLLGLKEVSAADRLALQEMLIHASIAKKDPSLTARVARQYLQAGGSQPSVRTALVQSLSQLGEHQKLVQDMESFLQLDRAQQRKTPEVELRLLGAARLQLKDQAGYFAVLMRLLELYPSKAYWADAIVRLTNLPGFNSRYELDAYRLLAETGNLEESAEYTEMAELALKAGLPAEALRVLEMGVQKGILGKGSDGSAHARLMTEAKKKSQEDDALMPQLELTAKDGNAWMAVAEAHASKQNWGAAVTAYDQSIKAGGLRREAEVGLRRGIALFKVGRKADALAQWQAVQGERTAMQMASLWILLAR